MIEGDSPEARRYNRVRRWLGIGDIALSLGFLLALLLLGWSSVVRDWAYRAAFQNYAFAVLFYVLILMVLAPKPPIVAGVRVTGAPSTGNMT